MTDTDTLLKGRPTHYRDGWHAGYEQAQTELAACRTERESMTTLLREVVNLVGGCCDCINIGGDDELRDRIKQALGGNNESD